MKRGCFSIALWFIAASLTLWGQVPAGFGLKGGISLANMSYRITPIDYELDTEPLFGPVATLFVEAFKGAHFSFQFDVGYVVKGSSTTTESVTVNHLDNDRITVHEGAESTSRFSYITLVPMARYRFDLERISPYLLLGPRIDFQLRYDTDSPYPLDLEHGTLLGLTVGAGLEYRLNDLGIFTEVQYLPDLSPVSNKEPLLINHNMLSLALGIRWIVSE